MVPGPLDRGIIIILQCGKCVTVVWTQTRIGAVTWCFLFYFLNFPPMCAENSPSSVIPISQLCSGPHETCVRQGQGKGLHRRFHPVQRVADSILLTHEWFMRKEAALLGLHPEHSCVAMRAVSSHVTPAREPETQNF